MPVGELLKGLFQRGHLKLTNTKRPYYLRSLSLVYACRQIADPPPEKQEQLDDLKVLFKTIEKALEFGTSHFREDSEATSHFEDAHQALSKYLAEHKVRFTESKSQVIKAYALGSSSWENAGKQDRDAGASLNKLATTLEKKMQELENIPTIKVPMQIWHDIPISVNTGSKLQCNSHLLDLIKIKETANLNILLHRLLEYAALHDKKGKSPLPIEIHLVQHPQFYPAFPSEINSFRATGGGMTKINSLEPWAKVQVVRKHGVLHLIMEQGTPDRCVQLWDGSYISLGDEHKNAWPLQDSKDTVVVRNRSELHAPSPGGLSDPNNNSSIYSTVILVIHMAAVDERLLIEYIRVDFVTGELASGTYSAPSTPNPSHTSVLDESFKPTEPSRPATSPPIQPSATQSPPAAKRPLPPAVLNFPASKPASDTNPQPPSATQNPPLIFQPQHPSSSASNADQEDAKADVNNQNSGTALPGFKGHNIRSSIGIGASQVRGKEKEKKRGGVFVWMKEKLEKFAG
ncbi:hypothetical protein GALMADRAFT_139011 [Galerina marginata CBS 339.88]|uniref:Uncharacterized protein n=1 Tax=Galerina marginata (strain CBS 339.88) TaxID=685588 RepID=A0A067T1J9_GALM3|nr:hypothetical protein GALMADRAFT_139011 [Galerina marginata CBS 339.88]